MGLAETGNSGTGQQEQPPARTVTVPGGLRLHYVDTGAPDGPPILLLHGYTDSGLSFHRLRPHLPAGYRVVSLDQRGHGDSDKPAQGYRRRDFAADALALLDALAIDQPVVVVGHSLGSLTAQRLAADHPHRLAGLVLIGSAAGAAANAGLLELQAALEPLREAPDRAFIREFQTGTVATPLPGDFLEAVIDESAKVPLHVWRQALADLLDGDQDVPLDAIRTPTLVIWGERDAVFSRDDQLSLIDGLGEASWRRFEATGHAPHWERPEATARELVEFLGRWAAADAPPAERRREGETTT